jgi:hypothetical protein
MQCDTAAVGCHSVGGEYSGMVVLLGTRSQEARMGLSSRNCPDCGRSVRVPFEKTITGRDVCPDCANPLFMGSAAGGITGNVGSGYGVWAMLMRKIRRAG